MPTDFAGRSDARPYAEIRETHTGLVMLVGDRAYKTKRPVVTDFLNFGTVALRERACARELELNSRLAPQAYLGIAQLSGPAPDEHEPVLVMQRYPDAARLSARVRCNADGLVADVESVAQALAAFHAGARRGREVEAEGKVAALTERWDANLAELEPFADSVIPGDMLRQVKELAHQYISGRSVLFASRIGTRRIVDGHADLLADDIFCVTGGPLLLDCLDFDDRLRYVDGIDDAAFLAMDLEFLGRRDLAEVFLDEYCRRSGDPAPRSLQDFYIAYRAVVRAKVDCIRHAQGHPEARADAVAHLELAFEHLRSSAVRLILVGGGPGTGKTTLARSLAGELGAHVISTDDLRKELQRSGVIVGDAGELDAGLYAPDNVVAVYAAALRQARTLLATGHSVILDGTWRDPRQRDRARELARDVYAKPLEFVCTATLAAATIRIDERTDTTSDATSDIAAALDSAGQTYLDGGGDVHRINTERPLADSVAEAHELCCLAI